MVQKIDDQEQGLDRGGMSELVRGCLGGLARLGEHIEWAELSLHSRRGTDCSPARMARLAVLDSFSHFPHINTRLVHIYRV